MLYMVTVTIHMVHIPQMLAYIPYMDAMIVYIYDKIDMEPIVFFSNETGFTCFFRGVKAG
jgi:hypothetical protein